MLGATARKPKPLFTRYYILTPREKSAFKRDAATCMDLALLFKRVSAALSKPLGVGEA